VTPLLAEYARAEPAVLWQASGATVAFVAGLGTLGYATRRDLSSLMGALFRALLGLIGFGLVGLVISIPGGNLIYCVAGLVVFGGFTVIDFNRLRRGDEVGAVPIAAGIFLDIFNVFLLLLNLFGGGGRD
jgi:FtsH-binding integral membrane protein